MKGLISLSLMLFAYESKAVCSSIIERSNFGIGEKLTSSRLNTELNTVYSRANELPGNCVTDETITSAKIVNGTLVNADISSSAAISPSKIAAPNYTMSSSNSGSFSLTNTSYTDVTNLTASITTNGKPVEIYLTGIAGSDSAISCLSNTSLSQCRFKFLRGATDLGSYNLVASSNGSTGTQVWIPSSVIRYLDTPSAGTYTYKLQAQGADANATLNVFNAKLVVKEL